MAGNEGKEKAAEAKAEEDVPAAQAEEQPKDPKPAPTQADLTRYEGYIGARWQGKCRWFNVMKGFGFIDPYFAEAQQANDDVFVHQSALDMPGFRSLDEGEEVEFVVALGRNGLEATQVQGINGTELRGSSIRPLGKHFSSSCYKCGLLGYHRASKCKKEIPTKSCYNCHSSDHLVSECPTVKQKDYKPREGQAPSKPTPSPTKPAAAKPAAASSKAAAAPSKSADAPAKPAEAPAKPAAAVNSSSKA